jgi:hypothetical protein
MTTQEGGVGGEKEYRGVEGIEQIQDKGKAKGKEKCKRAAQAQVCMLPRIHACAHSHGAECRHRDREWSRAAYLYKGIGDG